MKLRGFLLLILIVFLLPGSVVIAKNWDIRVKSNLSSSFLKFGQYVTNRLLVNINGDTSVIGAICMFPQDPRVYGLEFIDLKYHEKLILSKNNNAKIFSLSYIFKPKFIGVIAINPLEIKLVNLKTKKTNSVFTKKKSIEVVGESQSSFLWFLLLIALIITVGVFLIIRFYKQRKHKE